MHDHDHDHDDDHGHPHEAPPDSDGPLTYYQRLEIALRELLIAKGMVSADELRRRLEHLDTLGPAGGARVVARAWVDPAYKARLLADGTTAVEELGIRMDNTKLIVLENTPRVHNMVVCTLCSCYPRPVLGLPPDWYKSKVYRSRAVRAPRALLAEFGTIIPEEVEVRVHDSTAVMRYLVLPMRPADTEDLDEAALAALITRDSMIGVSLPLRPEAVAPR